MRSGKNLRFRSAMIQQDTVETDVQSLKVDERLTTIILASHVDPMLLNIVFVRCIFPKSSHVQFGYTSRILVIRTQYFIFFFCLCIKKDSVLFKPFCFVLFFSLSSYMVSC